MTTCTSRAAWLNLLRRLHFYIGLFIGPFIFVAALTGTLYVATPQLENWLYYYKQLWRTVSKQSELGRIAEVLGWWADYLRTVDCRSGALCREAKQAE